MGMQLIEKVHVLPVGPSISADGIEVFHTGDDLDQLAETYDEKIHEAPVILGHSSDGDWSKLLSRNDSFPADGWIKRLYREGNDLYADLDASPELVSFINDQKYKKRSLGYYGRDSKNNPTKGQLYARHLALLGASPPAIKGLQEVKLSEGEAMTDPEIKELLDKNVENWLAYILKDEGNIIGDTIVGFDPQPSPENNYLFNADESKWAGTYVTDDNDRYNFEIVEQTGDKGESEFIVSVKAEGGAAAEKGGANEQKETTTMSKEKSNENIQMSEDNPMLLKEKTITEKEYAPEEQKPKGEEMINMEKPNEMENMEKPNEMENMEKPVEMMEHEMEEKPKEEEEKPVPEGGEPIKLEEAPAETLEEGEKPETKGEGEEMKEGCYGEGCGDRENAEHGEYGEYSEEEMKAMKEELEMLRAKVKQQEEQEMKNKEEELIRFSESLYDGAKVLDTQYPKAKLEELLKGLLHTGEHMIYGEGDAKTDALSEVKNLLNSLPEQVTLAEGLVTAPPKPHQVKFRSNYSKGSQERSAKIYSIMDERNIPRTNIYEYIAINKELTKKEGHYEK